MVVQLLTPPASLHVQGHHTVFSAHSCSPTAHYCAAEAAAAAAGAAAAPAAPLLLPSAGERTMSKVMPAARRRSASTRPMAVAGVRTPPGARPACTRARRGAVEAHSVYGPRQPGHGPFALSHQAPLPPAPPHLGKPVAVQGEAQPRLKEHARRAPVPAVALGVLALGDDHLGAEVQGERGGRSGQVSRRRGARARARARASRKAQSRQHPGDARTARLRLGAAGLLGQAQRRVFPVAALHQLTGGAVGGQGEGACGSSSEAQP